MSFYKFFTRSLLSPIYRSVYLVNAVSFLSIAGLLLRFCIPKVTDRPLSYLQLHDLRQKQLGLQQRIQLKWDAIAALPEGFLRDEASKEDLTPFPPRRMPTWTPPIPGFSNRDDASARDADRRRR